MTASKRTPGGDDRAPSSANSSTATPATLALQTCELTQATLPLLSLTLKSTDIEALGRELAHRLALHPDFFRGDGVLIDLSRLARASSIDFHSLIGMLAGLRLRALAVRGGSQAQHAAANDAGLMTAPEGPIRLPPDL